MYRLTEIRKNKKLTQSDVAALLGISRQAYSNYELGNRAPDYDTLIKLADCFGVTVDYLLGRNTDKIPLSIIKPSPIQEAYDNAPAAIQEAVRKLLDIE